MSIVEVNKPPITTVASGRCTSAPAPVDIAIGKNPIAAAPAVSITGRSLSFVPCKINSRILIFPSCLSSFKCSISTIPLSTAIPKSAINPTPADTLKGIPLNQSSRTPPTVASGIDVKIIIASFSDLKAKCKKTNISKSATGTAINSRFVAFCRFSNCPP